MILQEQLFEEIALIPTDKYKEIYDLLHHYRLGLMQEKIKQPSFDYSENNLSLPVLEAFNASLSEFDELYQELAK
ncbi:MAG: hypothetical protein NTW85_01790 [Methylococcales bacterium]|nr:hypothetical protein [Methylococcales bacterium]